MKSLEFSGGLYLEKLKNSHGIFEQVLFDNFALIL